LKAFLVIAIVEEISSVLEIATGRLRKLDIQINCYPIARKPSAVS